MQRVVGVWVVVAMLWMATFWNHEVVGQEMAFPQLDRAAMREDAEFLLRTLEECNLQLPLRKRLTGIDHLAEAGGEFESAIDTISGMGGASTTPWRACYCV